MRYLLLALALLCAVPTCGPVAAQDKAPAVTGAADDAIKALEEAREALRKLDASYAAQIEALTAERKKIAAALGQVAPKPPDALSEIATQARDLALTKVPEAGRAATAQRLADAILSVQPQAGYAALLTAAVKGALGSDLPNWQQWSKLVGEVLFANGVTQQAAPEKAAAAWSEVAKGLRGVK